MTTNPSARANAPMMAKSILRPVAWVMLSATGTSWLRFIPSGVSSKAQERISAIGNPRSNNTATSVAVQSGS